MDRSRPTPNRSSFRAVFSDSIALTMAIAGVAFAALAQTGTKEGTMNINIAAMAVGQPPRSFDSLLTGQGDVGTWLVVEDATAETGRAIAQVSRDRTDYRFPLAVYSEVSAPNVDVTVRFKPVAGEVDQAGGIAVRLSDANNYYVVRANALEDNVRFYRVVDGRRVQIKGANVKVASGVWHTLGLRAEGEWFTIACDGKPLYTVEDKTFAGAGKVALWTKADSVTHFDKLAISNPR
ncbi:MAG TPA: hypothetical protein VGB82_24790 [Alphaproteobacteria bacterium]